MIGNLPAWAAIVTAVLVFAGAATTLIGSVGLLRFESFYERLHAPTLGTTVGTGCIALASIIFFSTSQSRLALHEILIVVFVTITTPVTLMVLVRAALFRDRAEKANDASERDAT
jgi:multicomponent K+:H+ antiporter subunit G